MKKSLLTLAVLSALTACGGGGDGSSSGGSNNSNPTTNDLSNSSSTVYVGSLKVIAETWIAGNAIAGLHDLVMFAGQTGNCAGGGSLSYTSPTQTLTNCVRNYPNNGAYNGTYSGTGSAGAINVTAINNVTVNSSVNPANNPALYAYSSGSFGATLASAGGTDTTTLTSGSVVFQVVGAANSYTLSNFKMALANSGTGTVASTVGGFTRAYVIARNGGGSTYDVNFTTPITTSGTNNPASGTAVISYTTSTACSPLTVSFLSTTQFSMACSSGSPVTKSWTDADVRAALAAARQ
jgi:hypothetical protein